MKKWISAAATAAGAYLIAIAPRLCERPERMPKVYYAHRGLHDNISDAPENSLAAFQKAVDAGYGIELDVQMTADGKVVVVHDFNLKRISGVDKEIDQCTYEELQDYPIYGSDQRVPLFEDVLKAVDGKVPLIVELKYKEGSKICEKAQEILNGYTGIYCIESFHPQVLVWYRKNYPHICRGNHADGDIADNRCYGCYHQAVGKAAALHAPYGTGIAGKCCRHCIICGKPQKDRDQDHRQTALYSRSKLSCLVRLLFFLCFFFQICFRNLLCKLLFPHCQNKKYNSNHHQKCYTQKDRRIIRFVSAL